MYVMWYNIVICGTRCLSNLAHSSQIWQTHQGGSMEGSWKALQSLFYAFEALRSINGYIYNIYALLHFINSWYLNTFSPQEC